MEDHELLLTLGNNLKKYRGMKHLTQEQIAELAGISYPFYANLERGGKGVSIYTLRRLADILEISVDTLLSEDLPDEERRNLLSFLRDKPEPFIKAVNYIARSLYESGTIH